MIIERVTLSSFAGVSERTVAFSPGLNIVFGRNEAGKSTIFHAIEHVLLTSAKLSKTRFNKEMGQYRPAGGGDTIRAALDFALPSGRHSLKKSWGASGSVELTLPDGSLVTDDASVAHLMEGLLPASPAIIRAVFLTYQSGMERVLADLEKSPDALFDLREVLRRAFEGEDGYGADRFKARVEEEIDSYYGRWDKTAGGPEQGRGISNPWKQGCGKIVAAWYAVEELKRDLKIISNGEDELAVVAANLDKALQEQKQVTAFLSDHEKARDFASVRGDTLREIDQVERLEETHKTAYDEWPRALERRAESVASLETKKQKLDVLAKERAKAKEYDRRKSRIKEATAKLQKAREYTKALTQSREKMENGSLISDEAFAALRTETERLESLKREIGGGSLSLSVEAQKEVELEIRKGIDDPERVKIKEGERFSFDAEGAVTIGHHDFTVTVGPGKADFPALEEDYREAIKRLSGSLVSLGVKTMEEAAQRHGEYVKIAQEARLAGKMLEATLAGESAADLETEVSSSSGEAPEKPIEEIQEELTTTEHEIRNLETGLAVLDEKLKGYATEYGERKAVLDLLLADREKKRELEKRIDGAPELPEGFDDWSSVIQSCSDHRSRRDELSEQILVLEKRKTELVTAMPDESAEEMELKLNRSAAKLEKTVAGACAFERILKRTNELLSEPEVEITDELKRSFEGQLKEITAGRYTRSRFSGDLPDGLLRKDGTVLSFSQLSSGTRDGFSLALRLATARCFIGDSDGFVIMDDPLVDMDDSRRPAAAAVLDAFAAGVQTIIFTCHENHAALFDKSRVIRLD